MRKPCSDIVGICQTQIVRHYHMCNTRKIINYTMTKQRNDNEWFIKIVIIVKCMLNVFLKC